MGSPLFEIVPNISEGRDAAVVAACADAIARASARVIHCTSDETHNRSVITAVGERERVLAAAIALAGVAAERIDLRVHRGEHPRIGALDVLPFIPLRHASLADAARLAHEAGARIWETHRIPSYYYGAAAKSERRRLLPDVRKGEFEGLAARMREPGWEPDNGDRPHESAGAVAIGARELLIAFNIELDTGDVELARSIARMMRERTGGLERLRALGLTRGPDAVQVSFNITDFEATPIYRVVELVRALAAERGVAILRSELIGLAPREAIVQTAAYYAHQTP